MFYFNFLYRFLAAAALALGLACPGALSAEGQWRTATNWEMRWESSDHYIEIKSKATWKVPKIKIETKHGALDLSFEEEAMWRICTSLLEAIAQASMPILVSVSDPTDGDRIAENLERQYDELGCDDVIGATLVAEIEKEIRDRFLD